MISLSLFPSKKTEKKCGLNLSITFNTGINARCLIRELVITGDTAFRTYKASMEMKDFPKCGSEREAALKLAEWMQRMAAAIENYWSEP